MPDVATHRLKEGQLLPELVAARGLAAVWIVFAHTLAYSLQGFGDLPRPVEYSRLIVDFFFVLSGFVLAHVYDAPWRAGRFRYVTFLGRRLSRLYPLHLATLLVVLAIVTVGSAFGMRPHNPHDTQGFFATLFLLHSAWTTGDLAWNWPSWSVSAEWFAYLAIPLFFMAADRIRGMAARVFAALGAFAAASAFSHLWLGHDLVTLTFDGGALRVAPSFLTGILLRRIFDDALELTTMTPRRYVATLCGVAAGSAALILIEAPYDTLWPLMVVLVAALAARGAWPEPGVLRGPVLAWLGEMSYAIYLTHAIVLQVTFGLAERLGVGGELWQRFVVGAVSILGVMIASYVAYVVVEKPGRGVMAALLGMSGKAARPAPASSGSGQT